MLRSFEIVLGPTGPMPRILDDVKENANGKNVIVNAFYEAQPCFTDQLDNARTIKMS